VRIPRLSRLLDGSPVALLGGHHGARVGVDGAEDQLTDALQRRDRDLVAV
jgi:hypothetical protein